MTEKNFNGHHFFYSNSLIDKVRLFIHVFYQLLVKSSGTELVHLSVFHETYWIAFLSRIILRKPVLCTEHWTGYNNGKYQELPKWKRMMIRWSSSFVDEFLPVTDHLGLCIEKCLNRKITYSILPNVVDTDVFTADPRERKNFDFIHISTLDSDHKRPEAILRQFAVVKDRNCDATIAIGGDGDDTAIKKMAEKLNITDSVTFFGELNSEEVALKIRQSCCLVLFSRYENFPCVIPEAWACGVPVIASDVGGIREWLTEDLGILVNPDREDELGKAMLLFMEKRESFSCEVLAGYATRHFGKDSVAKLIEIIYNRHVKHD